MKKNVTFYLGMVFLLVIFFLQIIPNLINLVSSDTGLMVTRSHASEIFRELTLAGELNHGNNKWALFPTSTNRMAHGNQLNAGDYFATVLERVHEQALHTNTYVTLLPKNMLFADWDSDSLQGGSHDSDLLCKWIIAEDIDPEWPDFFPVLMTSNIDPVLVNSCMLGNNEKKLFCNRQKSRFSFFVKRQSGLIVCKNGSIILLSSIHDGTTMCRPHIYGLLSKWSIDRHTIISYLTPIGKTTFYPLLLRKKSDDEEQQSNKGI